MNVDFLTSSTAVAYFTALAIFVLTIILVTRKQIGFMITLLLLAFALISGLAIANHDLLREILTKYSHETKKEEQSTTIKDQLKEAFEELKEEFNIQKKKLGELYDSYTAPKDQTKEKP